MRTKHTIFIIIILIVLCIIFISLFSQIDLTDYTKLSANTTYSPAFSNYTIGSKRFKDGELLFLNGSFTNEIFATSEKNRIGGVCIPYDYDAVNKIFTSRDTVSPHYGGYNGVDLSKQVSQQVLISLLKLKANVIQKTNEIGLTFLCELENKQKILISDSSKNQPNQDTFAGLLYSDYGLVGKVELPTPENKGSIEAFPIIYTTNKIFYLKIDGLMYTLFKINFVNNTYTILYQGK